MELSVIFNAISEKNTFALQFPFKYHVVFIVVLVYIISLLWIALISGVRTEGEEGSVFTFALTINLLFWNDLPFFILRFAKLLSIIMFFCAIQLA